MLTQYEVRLSDAQKREILVSTVNELAISIHINDPVKAPIIHGLKNYLETIAKRRTSLTGRMGFNTTDPRRVTAALQIAKALEASIEMGELYTAVVCAKAYNSCFISQGDLDSSDLADTIGSAISRYHKNIVVPKINLYFNAGINLILPCLVALMFAPNNTPPQMALFAGLALGLCMLLCSEGIKYGVPETAKIDDLLTKNPQMVVLLDNLAGVAQSSISVVNRGLTHMNRRMLAN